MGRRGGIQQLYVRELGRDDARPLPGTEGAQAPAVSTDGRFVTFWASREIKRAPIPSGPPHVDARYVRSGHLVFMRQGVLMAAAFDVDGLRVRGEPAPVLDAVLTRRALARLWIECDGPIRGLRPAMAG